MTVEASWPSDCCPLCNGFGRIGPADACDAHQIYCQTCGSFRVTFEAMAILKPRWQERLQMPNDWPRLSFYCRAEYEFGGKALIDQALAETPPELLKGLNNTAKQMRLLKALARKYPVSGTAFTYDGGTDWPLASDTGRDEGDFHLRALIAKQLLEQTMKPSSTMDGDWQWTGEISPKGWELIEQTGAGFVQENLAFVAMSFEPTLMPVFHAVVLGAENAGYVAKRVDSDLHADQIDLRLIDMMRMSRFVIADLTDQKRNVYFEAGFAKGMDKPVIWTVRKDQLELLAFDIKQFYFIAWESEADLAMRLEQAIGAIIGRRKK